VDNTGIRVLWSQSSVDARIQSVVKTIRIENILLTKFINSQIAIKHLPNISATALNAKV
jgi:hypothetical protein